MSQNCVLCNGLNDNFKNIMEQYVELQSNVVLFETPNFKIIPDKFPIATNHIIILPKAHINTFSELDKSEETEIEGILNRLENVTKSKNFIMFEHGTSKKEEFNTPSHIKSIFHAHLHFIPDVKCNTQDIELFFEQKGVTLCDSNGKKKDIEEFETKYSRNSDLINFIRNSVMYEDRSNNCIMSYFYIKNSDNTQLFFPEKFVTPQIPSQFLREALSEQCDTPEWNWKVGMSAEGRQKYGTRIIQMVKLFANDFQSDNRLMLTKLNKFCNIK